MRVADARLGHEAMSAAQANESKKHWTVSTVRLFTRMTAVLFLIEFMIAPRGFILPWDYHFVLFWPVALLDVCAVLGLSLNFDSDWYLVVSLKAVPNNKGCLCRETLGMMESGGHPSKFVNIAQWVRRQQLPSPTRSKVSQRIGNRTEVRSLKGGVRSRGEAGAQAA